MCEPFALQLYRRLAAGETAQRIADDTGIPLERVRSRLRAAAHHMNGRSPDDIAGISTSTVGCNVASAGQRLLKYCGICRKQTWRQSLGLRGFESDVSVCMSCVERALTSDKTVMT
jgi:hypothetical protein